VTGEAAAAAEAAAASGLAAALRPAGAWAASCLHRHVVGEEAAWAAE